MGGVENLKNTGTMLAVNFVGDQYFVDRIHELERKYNMEWEQFMAQYTTGQLPGGCQNTDFAEWAFLCNNFMAELLKPYEESPPTYEQTVEGKKPEADSGFFNFAERICLTPHSTSRTSTMYFGRAGNVSPCSGAGSMFIPAGTSGR